VSVRTTVVKVGGSTLGSSETLIRDVADLQRSGQRIVVVHGGGEAISRRLEEAGIKAEFVDGLRSTDERAMPLVIESLEAVNSTVAGVLRGAGINCRQFATDSGLLKGRRIQALGRVGEVVEVDAAALLEAARLGAIPVVAPVARDVDDGGLLNVNGDTAAGEIAIAVGASRLIFATDVEGVRSRDGELLPVLHIDDAAVLLADGTASGGMTPKLRASMKAAGAGIECIILDGRVAGSLRNALEGAEVVGTRIGQRAFA
jgi:acetylglutamate kinase